MVVDRALVEAALPAYDVGDVVGAGSFGSVRVGRHRGLDRPVAIKVLTPGTDGADGTADDTHHRFSSEAQILAGIDHPHVVRVFDFVEQGELRILVMEHLAGGTLSARMPSGVSAEAACAVGLSAAEALGCAHAAGVLHRDVKPANILFAGDGTVKVADFGVAKLFGGSAVSASVVAGTFGFMPPEQIRAGRLGPGSDLYALGVVLYRLLSGRMPFDTRLPLDQLLRRQVDTAPPRPPGVAEPLADVVMHVLATSLGDRPASARAFALELAEAARHVLGPAWLARAGGPVHLPGVLRDAAAGAQVRVLSTRAAVGVDVPPQGFAGPAGPGARDPRDPRGDPPGTSGTPGLPDLRNKDLRGADLSGFDLSGIRLAGTDLSGARLRGASLAGARLERVSLARADLSGADLSGAALIRTDLSAATLTGSRWRQARLLSCVVDADREFTPELADSVRPGRDPAAVNVAPAGNPARLTAAPHDEVAAVVWGGAVVLLDLAERRLTRVFPGDGGARGAAVFSPDGELLACADGTSVRVWGVASDFHRTIPPAGGSAVTGLCFTAASGLLAIQDEEGAVRTWHPDSGRIRDPLPAASDAGVVCAFSADGELFARWSSGRAPVEVLEVATGRLRARIRAEPGRPAAMAFSPDGGRLAVATDAGAVGVWDLASGRRRLKLSGQAVGADAYQTKPVFGPDGGVLAVGPTLVETGTGRTSELPAGPPPQAQAQAPAPGSSPHTPSQAPGSSPHTLSQAPGAPGSTPAHARGAPLRGPVVFNRDGDRLAAAGGDGSLLTWRMHEGRWEAGRVMPPAPVTHNVSFSPGQKMILGSTGDEAVSAWDAASGELLWAAAPRRRRVNGAAGSPPGVRALLFSPDGGCLVTGGGDGQVRIWDAATLRQRERFRHRRPVVALAVSPDGELVAAADGHGPARIWDVATGRELVMRFRGPAAGGTSGVAFGPDGFFLAAATVHGAVAIVHAASGEHRATLAGHAGAVNGVAFSPDGRTLASAGADRTVRLWDVPSGRERTALTGHTGPVNDVAFSPDGRTLASAGADRTVRLWESHGAARAVYSHAGAVACVAFSPDGRTLAGAGEEPAVKLWDVRSGNLATDLACRAGGIDGVDGVAFSPSGQLLASAGADGTVRMHDVDDGTCLLRLVGTDDGWAALLPDGSYKIGGGAVDAVWWSVGRSRFDAGELDPHCTSVRWLADDAVLPLSPSNGPTSRRRWNRK
jgi:WD40 repeat protein